MKVDIKRDKNRKWESCNLLNLSIKEQTNITVALSDYYYKLKDLKLYENAEIVKEMLSKLDINV